MIQDAEKKMFDRIIFIKLDRFFRSVAEYHECMKRISPVTWTTTEEEYDLNTANGRLLVNMKLTIAELEADQTSERIKLVNEYKVQTGQPLYGTHSLPISHKVATIDGKKVVVKDPDNAVLVDDLIQHFMTFQNKRQTLKYAREKYNSNISDKSLFLLLRNPLLCGEYKGNPNYCEAYISRAAFDKIQEILSRNVKRTPSSRVYIFSGLIRCPICGHALAGNMSKANGKRYRCNNRVVDVNCTFNKVVIENTIERLLLENIEQYLDKAKLLSFEVAEAKKRKPRLNVEAIQAEIDRLNYSWQKNRIATVEEYDRKYEELSAKLSEAMEVEKDYEERDFSHVENILTDGWRNIYNALDEEHKRAFWRSFIKSIEVDWSGDKGEKKITKINFF